MCSISSIWLSEDVFACGASDDASRVCRVDVQPDLQWDSREDLAVRVGPVPAEVKRSFGA